MKTIHLNPNDKIILKSTGKYGQTLLIDVFNDGTITFRNVEKEQG